MNSLDSFKRKILRKIYDPFFANDEYRSELYDMYDEADIVGRIKIQRLRYPLFMWK